MNLVQFQSRKQSLDQVNTEPREEPQISSRVQAISTRPRMQRIVLLTDFSSLARQAYSSALEMAIKYDAVLLLVHVDRLRAPEYSGVTNTEYLDALRERIVSESRRPEFDGFSVKPILKSFRDVSREVESLGSVLDADIVVASTLATSGWQRLNETDRAEMIVTKASVPALLHGPQNAALNPSRLRRVLVYGDTVESVAKTVPMIQSLDCSEDCSIKLLLPRSSMRSPWFSRGRAQQVEHDRSFQIELFDLVKVQLADYNVEVEFTDSSATDAIRRHSQEMDSDLIVLGTNRKYSAAHRTVVRESRCPVLLVRSE